MRLKSALCMATFSLGLALTSQAQDRGPSEQAPQPSIGLEIGQKAAAFSANDQFGHEQSNETLKGSGGTIILFFRSADW